MPKFLSALSIARAERIGRDNVREMWGEKGEHWKLTRCALGLVRRSGGAKVLASV